MGFNFADLLLRVGPGIQAIFKLSYEPKEEMFYELTPEQYSKLESEGSDISKKWFTIVPDNPEYEVPEVIIFDEEQKQSLLDAVKYIDGACNMEKDRKFDTFDDKLRFLATWLPPVFTENSEYEAQKTALKNK